MLLNFWSTDPTYKKDYYKVLGVSSNADQKQIKKAYFDVSIMYQSNRGLNIPPPPPPPGIPWAFDVFCCLGDR